ncbi:hypothetical protein OF83DRAFT_48116 [Amylostereum chailletii]|nr:hypothetical protein OF83DRAFT_48116 [Amylostereum chailletii]
MGGPAGTVPYTPNTTSMMLSMVTLEDISQNVPSGYALLVQSQGRSELQYIAPGNAAIRWSPYIFHSDEVSTLPSGLSIASTQGQDVLIAQISSERLEEMTGEEGEFDWVRRRVERIRRPKRGRKGASIAEDGARWMEEVMYALKEDGVIEKEVYEGLLTDGVLRKPNIARRGGRAGRRMVNGIETALRAGISALGRSGLVVYKALLALIWQAVGLVLGCVCAPLVCCFGTASVCTLACWS